MFNYLRFRWRRSLRRIKRGTRVWRKQIATYAGQHIWGKWRQVAVVRRFLLVWVSVLIVGLIGLTQQIQALHRATQISVPVAGGTYSEAAVGTVKILNPVLPESTLSGDINRLIFSGLTRYDARRRIAPDLAKSWEVSPDGRTYTFHLRKGVKWHDGVPFTAADVAFTLTAIQDADSRSPLASSWQGVKTDTRGDDTVIFTLPNPLTSFIDSTTLSIVPRHLLESVEPSQLREARFNQNPVGTGPFKLKTFAPSAKEISLAANPHYYAGRPQLDEFRFQLYDTPDQAIDAYAKHQVVSPGRIRPEQLGRREKLADIIDYQFSLPEETVLFFRTGDATLADKTLRQILIRSLDRKQIINRATSGQALALTQPILPGQTGYTARYALAPVDAATTKRALDEAGWRSSKPGAVRSKDGLRLDFKITTLRGGELERAAKAIARQWEPLGIKVSVQPADLTTLQQTHMRPRNFQMLLFGINVGADPDVYSFWHSSQAADPGLNLSGYTSPTADTALEAGRIKTDHQVRTGKYDTFLKAWNEDAPAAVLYETGYQYAARDQVSGIAAGRLAKPDDRFYNVASWTVKREWVEIVTLSPTPKP